MKKYMIVLVSILLLVCQLSLGATVSAATGALTVTSSANTAIVGENITVTVTYNGNNNKIASISSVITYDANKLTLVSGRGPDGATTHGDAGVIRAIFEMPSTGILPTSVTYTLVFKATSTGNSEISVTTEEFINNDDTYSSLGSPSKTISIAASNPSLSGDATLKTLYPTKGTLTPKFDKNVTEYTVSVPYTVTRGLLVFEPTDPNAKSVVTENADLKVGKNARVITVTAPNGATKKYTVTFVREAQENTTTGDSNGSTTTTTIAPQGDPQVEIDGVIYDMVVAQPSVTLPAGFAWDFITIGDNEVAAAKQENGSLTLVYLTAQDAESGAFYIYDAMTDTFSPFRQITGAGVVYVLHDLPSSEVAPLGTVAGTVTLGEDSVSAYVYEDPTLADFAIVYLTDANGISGYYTYDTVEGTLQRYHTVTVEKEVATPVDPEPQVENNPVIAFVKTYQQVILVGAAALAGLAVLIIVIVWIISQSGGNKGKH